MTDGFLLVVQLISANQKLHRLLGGRMKITFPTDGKPMRATRASPDFRTSKPSPLLAFLGGSSN